MQQLGQRQQVAGMQPQDCTSAQRWKKAAIVRAVRATTPKLWRSRGAVAACRWSASS